jgi:hypothetical protein
LNNECSFCYQRGHFKSGCPAIAERDRCQKKAVAAPAKPVIEKKKTVTFSNTRGGFAALDESSEDDAPVATKRKFQPPKEEWPSLSTVAAKPANDKPSFASIAANPAPVKKVDTSRPNICGFSILTKAGAEYVPKKEEPNKEEQPKRVWKSWAASDTESDGDDENEDEDW